MFIGNTPSFNPSIPTPKVKGNTKTNSTNNKSDTNNCTENTPDVTSTSPVETHPAPIETPSVPTGTVDSTTSADPWYYRTLNGINGVIDDINDGIVKPIEDSPLNINISGKRISYDVNDNLRLSVGQFNTGRIIPNHSIYTPPQTGNGKYVGVNIRFNF